MKFGAAVLACTLFGDSEIAAFTAPVAFRTKSNVSSFLQPSQQSSSRLHVGYGQVAEDADPYAGLLNKVDGDVPDSSMKVLDGLTKSISNAASDAGSTGSWFGKSVGDSGSAQQALEGASKAATEASVSASVAAQAMASTLDGTVKSAVSRTIPAMKAKVAAGGVVAAGTAPTLSDFLAGKRQVTEQALSSPNPMEKLALLKSNLMNIEPSAGFDTDGITGGNINNLLDQFGVKEYGAWYLVVIAGLIAIGQRNEGQEEARHLMEQDLKIAEAKAAEAAEAAIKAADGAKKVKELVIESKQKGDQEKSAEAAKLQEVLVEQENLKKQLDLARKEASELRSKIETLLSEKEATSSPPSNTTSQKNTAPQKAVVAPAPVAKVAPTPAPAAKVSTATAPQPVPSKSSTAAATANAKKTAPTKGSTATTSSTAAKPVAKAVQRSKAVQPKKTAEPEKARAPKKASEPKESASKNAIHPWASLAESTLKRKTVAQLSEFLSERGVEATKNGKPLMKKDLLSKVKTFL